MKGRGRREQSGAEEGRGPLSPPPASMGGDPHDRAHQDTGAPWQGLVLGGFGVTRQAGKGCQGEPEKISYS